MLVENGMHFARVAAFNFSASGVLGRSARLDVLWSWKASKWAFPKTSMCAPNTCCILQGSQNSASNDRESGRRQCAKFLQVRSHEALGFGFSGVRFRLLGHTIPDKELRVRRFKD